MESRNSLTLLPGCRLLDHGSGNFSADQLINYSISYREKHTILGELQVLIFLAEISNLLDTLYLVGLLELLRSKVGCAHISKLKLEPQTETQCFIRIGNELRMAAKKFEYPYWNTIVTACLALFPTTSFYSHSCDATHVE